MEERKQLFMVDWLNREGLNILYGVQNLIEVFLLI